MTEQNEQYNEPEQAEVSTEDQIPTYDDIAVVLDDMVSGIKMALKRMTGDDLSSSRLNRSIESIELIKYDLGRLINAHDDEYNALVEQAESVQTSNGLLMLRVRELETELNNAANHTAQILESERAAHAKKRQQYDAELKELREGAEALQSTTKLLVSENRMMTTRINDYVRMEPEKLQQKNAKLKTEKAELTKSNATLQTKFNQLQTHHTRLQLDLARSESHAAELSADLNEQERQDALLGGNLLIDKFYMESPINSVIQYFPYIFKWGLNQPEGGVLVNPTRRHPAQLLFIQGLDFHIQIRTTLGIDLTCKITEFGRTIYMVPEQMEKHWPDGLDDIIQEYHLEQLERLSTPLYDRAMWCREQHISTLPFVPEKFHAQLIEAKLDSLYSLGSSTHEDVKKIKGMGDATFTKIRQACIAMLESYEHESGPVSLLIDAPHVKPNLYNRTQAGIKGKLEEIKSRMKDDEAA